jgi:hypothetical protein
MKQVYIYILMIGIFLICTSSKTNKVLKFYRNNKTDVHLLKQLLETELKEHKFKSIVIQDRSYSDKKIDIELKILDENEMAWRYLFEDSNLSLYDHDNLNDANFSKMKSFKADSVLISITKLSKSLHLKSICTTSEGTEFLVYGIPEKFLIEVLRPNAKTYGLFISNNPITFTIENGKKATLGRHALIYEDIIDEYTIVYSQ